MVVLKHRELAPRTPWSSTVPQISGEYRFRGKVDGTTIPEAVISLRCFPGDLVIVEAVPLAERVEDMTRLVGEWLGPLRWQNGHWEYV